MFLERIFQFQAAPKKAAKTSASIDIAKLTPTNAMKVKVMALNFHHALTSLSVSRDRALFEESSYNFARIIEAVDSDSYVKQAFAKYRELFWKEGWEIIGENEEAVQYLWQRIDFMEEVMGRPFDDYLSEVVDQLVRFSNAFIVEARDERIRAFYPGRIKGPDDKPPIAGYYTIPTETVRIHRNKNNRPIHYKQVIDDIGYAHYGEVKNPIWNADEVIHFALDKKPGRAFGTPYLTAALDDVISLRQMEEDILNLVHKELFPLYTYTVGTPDKPPQPEDIEQAYDQIENLRTDGGLIIPGTHSVDVLGGDGKALDASPYLAMIRERVAVGLGVFPHHLGMSMEGGNRAVTDRLDIALYDKIKDIQRYVEGIIRVRIFNPILREGGFNPSPTPIGDGPSDRCYMRFREIDIDTQIKRENHVIQKYANNIADLAETRRELGLPEDFDMGQLLLVLTTHMQTLQTIAATQAAPQKTATGGTKVPSGTPKTMPPAPAKPDAQPSAGKGRSNLPNARKGTGNLSRPSNQFGRRLSPNVRHSIDDDLLKRIVEAIEEKLEDE